MARSLAQKVALAIAVAAIFPASATAQPASRRTVAPPLVVSVFPPGARVGSTVEWTVTGRGFTRAKRVLVSGAGIETLDFEPKGDSSAVATMRVAADAAPGYRELRVEGPEGISNLVLVRVDTLAQVVEVEPNDDPDKAQTVPVGTAVAGVLRPTDVDHFLVIGEPGRPVTLDLEARRIGTSITPVLTVMNRRGSAIAQARESRSSDHDCRLAARFPADGALVVQVRDNTYAGNDSAVYRLRVTTTPFATGLFPLGGPRGTPVTVTASGGSLRTPLSKALTLPDTPGQVVDPGPFESPDGTVASPGTIVVGDDRELSEPGRDAVGVWLPSIGQGRTMNGRIARRGEVDRYAVFMKKGEKLRIRVQAEALGSWLDSVLTVRGRDGTGALAENDDFQANPNAPQARRGVNFIGLPEGTSDSQLDFEAPTDGPFVVEVSDRYGEGGPEYAYRLSVGASRPDFAVHVLIGNPNANGQVANVANDGQGRGRPGMFGVYNLSPGSKTIVNFVVNPEGRPGPVTVRVEGLPEGVTAEPVKVEMLGPTVADKDRKGPSPAEGPAPAKADNLVLDAASYASPGTGEFRVVATAEPAPGLKIVRTATATVGLEAVPSAVPARPITRTVDRFPIRVVGEPRFRPVGPPEPPRLIAIRVPGTLLQGDRIDLGLDFDQSPLADPGFEFDARARGIGLATNTVISSDSTIAEADEAPPSDVIVRVLASPKAVPGVYPVAITYSTTGGSKQTREVSVIVRAPVEALVRDEPIAIKPGGKATFWVGLRRARGAEVDVDLKVEGLPRGVKQVDVPTLKENGSEAEIKLEMTASARPLTKPTAVRVVAIARMPRGAVATESRIRPMIVAAPAD